jgi:hypothetical protein
VDAGRRRRLVAAHGDARPLGAQPLGLRLQGLGRGAHRDGAHHEALVRPRHALHDLVDPGALGLVADATREGDAGLARGVDQVAAGQRQLGGEPRPLVGERVLGHLDEERFALVDAAIDLGRAVLGAGARGEHRLAGGQEAVAREADIDEGGVEPGRHPIHPAEEDVADNAAAARALDQHLAYPAVGDQRHPGLEQAVVDEDLVDHSRPSTGKPSPASKLAVSKSGSPTTFVYEPLMPRAKSAARPWMA